MKENRLRAHLIRLYCVTVAVVLFAVLFATAALFYRDTAARNRESFSTLLFAISDQLRMEDTVSHEALKELEKENRLLLFLRDNGKPLLYNQMDSDGRQSLFSEVERRARSDGYDTATLPLTTQRRTSPIYTFTLNSARYLGAVSILPLDTGYRAVTMAQSVSAMNAGKAALLAAGYVAGVLLLCAAGTRFIDRALRPAVESSKRQTRFVAAASHELRSPLAVIAANAATIRDGRGASGEAAAVIGSECARMSRLVGDMLLLASADASDWPVKLAAIEPDTVLINAYEMYAPLFTEKACTLSLRLPEETLPKCAADGERLSQVLSILLDNALCYGMTPQCRTAELAAEARGKGICITVTDHGPGLSAEQKAQAFERFYRGDVSRRDKQHFGLGLSIAQELIRLQNGRLGVEDTPGGGCTFHITL